MIPPLGNPHHPTGQDESVNGYHGEGGSGEHEGDIEGIRG